MTLILQPTGRGNWAWLYVRFDGLHAPRPMDFEIGALYTLGSRVFRIIGALE